MAMALLLGVTEPVAAKWVDADDAAMDDLGMITAIVAGCGGGKTDRAVMDAEVSKYLTLHAKTAAERAHANARAKSATAKATQLLKANSQQEAVCILRDAAISDFIGKLKKANKTGASYQAAP